MVAPNRKSKTSKKTQNTKAKSKKSMQCSTCKQPKKRTVQRQSRKVPVKATDPDPDIQQSKKLRLEAGHFTYGSEVRNRRERQRKEKENIRQQRLNERQSSAQRRAILAVKRKEQSLAPILRLPDELLFQLISGVLDHTTLLALDATCSKFRKCNLHAGAWRILGSKCFIGIDFFDCATTFLETNRERKYGWKEEYFVWSRALLQFRPPFHTSFADTDQVHGIIRHIESDDTVVRTKFRLRGDELAASDRTFYLEINVTANCDNLSLALDDFDSGGKSSLTFSPDTGCIIKETKVQEWPRRVEGSYMQALPYSTSQKFRGKVALCVKFGMISFFRKTLGGNWECTGLCSDFKWAQGMRASPGMAFRDRGKYTTTITKVSNAPPFEPNFNPVAFELGSWSEINWYDTDED